MCQTEANSGINNHNSAFVESCTTRTVSCHHCLKGQTAQLVLTHAEMVAAILSLMTASDVLFADA